MDLNNFTTLFTLSGGWTEIIIQAQFMQQECSSPASSPFASEGTHSRGISNGTATLTSSNINTSGYTGIALNFSLETFSIGSTGNG